MLDEGFESDECLKMWCVWLHIEYDGDVDIGGGGSGSRSNNHLGSSWRNL